MGAITDLWKSERGLVAVLLIIACTVLASLGKMTFADWSEYTLYIFGTYAAAKTITGALQIVKGTPAAVAAPAPTPPSPPAPPSP
jgi:hypothetical protein